MKNLFIIILLLAVTVTFGQKKDTLSFAKYGLSHILSTGGYRFIDSTVNSPDTLHCYFLAHYRIGLTGPYSPMNIQEQSEADLKWYEGYIITANKYSPLFTNMYGGDLLNQFLWIDKKTKVLNKVFEVIITKN